jgi:hypothetical protein
MNGRYEKCIHKEPENIIPLRRTRRGWENNIKKHLKEPGCEVVMLIHMAEDRDK